MLDDRVAERLVRAHHLERDRGRGPAPVRRAAVGAEAHLEVGRHVALARVGEPCQLSDVAILERFAGDLAAELALAREDHAHLVDRHADVCRIAVVAGPVARARLRGEVLPEGLAAAVGELRTVRCERLLDLAGIVLLVRLAVVDIPAMARERVQHSGELTGVQQITESLGPHPDDRALVTARAEPLAAGVGWDEAEIGQHGPDGLLAPPLAHDVPADRTGTAPHRRQALGRRGSLLLVDDGRLEEVAGHQHDLVVEDVDEAQACAGHADIDARPDHPVLRPELLGRHERGGEGAGVEPELPDIRTRGFIHCGIQSIRARSPSSRAFPDLLPRIPRAHTHKKRPAPLPADYPPCTAARRFPHPAGLRDGWGPSMPPPMENAKVDRARSPKASHRVR